MENLETWFASLGIKDLGSGRRNWDAARLVEEAIRRNEGRLTDSGAFAVETGKYTGRSPEDRFIVKDDKTRDTVDWGPINQPISPEAFERLLQKTAAHIDGKDLFVQDLYAGADPRFGLRIRVVTETAWHSLFARQLLIRPYQSSDVEPDFTVISVPSLQGEGEKDGIRSEAFVTLDFTGRIVLIGGTHYAGEIKKSVFALMNYLLPDEGVCPMHCSANSGASGDTALFFGLSGTGKTTLSADPERRLIGDDEHGWSDTGVFNFEGGCYAKCIGLSPEREPQIWNAIRFGSVVENVVLDENRAPDYDDDSLTENTRAAYPVEHIEDAVIPGIGGQPRNVVFLSLDAFGVLPPIARLTPEQAMYYFLSGYTAKVAGTERGLGNEPVATFSACFAAPFLPRNPSAYAQLLGKKLRRTEAQCWLVNTGWIGGPHGVGQRIWLRYTRAMLKAALAGGLSGVQFKPHPVFGFDVPLSCPDVPADVLDARGQWKNPAAYDSAAKNLQKLFDENYKKFQPA